MRKVVPEEPLAVVLGSGLRQRVDHRYTVCSSSVGGDTESAHHAPESGHRSAMARRALGWAVLPLPFQTLDPSSYELAIAAVAGAVPRAFSAGGALVRARGERGSGCVSCTEGGEEEPS